MEELLHFVWKHKIFPLEGLCTTDGRPVEVIDAGLPNPDAGPDFFNAKLKINGIIWVGNIEIHTSASDWMKHGHHRDPAYDNVILHVAEKVDCEALNSTGKAVTQMQLSCPEYVRLRYDELQLAEIQPACYSVLSALPPLRVHSWLSALQAERLEQKTAAIDCRLKRFQNHWEDVFFITLCRNFGFGLNGDAFEAWATGLPFRAADKHRDNVIQVEALFFGQAGLLEEVLSDADDYYLQLQKEFRYLQHKFQLPAPMDAGKWRFLRLRPGNFPHVRLAQLANLYHREQSLFSRVMEAETPEDVRRLLAAGTSPYWEEHYSFYKASPHRFKRTGEGALNLILINTVVPFLYAYGRYKADDALCDRASRFLDSLKAEDNRITRQWSAAGLHLCTAADSQAVLQLQTLYCDRKDCLRCRFGFEYLRQNPKAIGW